MNVLRAIGGPIWRGLKFLWKAAWQAHVPLIWHILVVVAAAWGTYEFAPNLTEKFERQKIRSTYVSNNLEELNTLVGDYYVAIMRAANAAPEQSVAEFSKADELAMRLTWKSIEIGAVLPSDRDQKLMRKFAEDLQSVQRSAIHSRTPKGRQAFRANLTTFSRTAVRVIQSVAQRAELSIDPSPIPAPS